MKLAVEEPLRLQSKAGEPQIMSLLLSAWARDTPSNLKTSAMVRVGL